MEQNKRIVVVTGMSGAGKSTVLKFLEDIGFYCADNLPPSIIPRFAEVCFAAGEEYGRPALGIDIRGGRLFDDLIPAIAAVNAEGCAVSILYLDCDDETLLRRYKETRRSHPLMRNESLADSISEERRLTRAIREKADYIIDTGGLLPRELKTEINNIFLQGGPSGGIIAGVMSFGFKYGLPRDADLVFDVRFMPNPFYVPELKELTGNDAEVRDFVMSHEVAVQFLDKTRELLDVIMPKFVEEGKTRLVICIGCTGGRHRSVTLANSLYEYLSSKGYSTYVKHRDIQGAKG